MAKHFVSVEALATLPQIEKITAACLHFASVTPRSQWRVEDPLATILEAPVYKNTTAKNRVGLASQWGGQCRIEIAAGLWRPDAVAQKYFSETLLHEIAHLIVGLFGCRLRGDSHGPAWQRAMRLMGQAAEVYADWEKVQAAGLDEKPRYLVTCSREDCKLVAYRHRVAKSIRNGTHAKCGGNFIVTDTKS